MEDVECEVEHPNDEAASNACKEGVRILYRCSALYDYETEDWETCFKQAQLELGYHYCDNSDLTTGEELDACYKSVPISYECSKQFANTTREWDDCVSSKLMEALGRGKDEFRVRNVASCVACDSGLVSWGLFQSRSYETFSERFYNRITGAD